MSSTSVPGAAGWQERIPGPASLPRGGLATGFSRAVFMAQIIVNVWDPTGNMRREVELPDDIPVGRIIPVLTEKMDLPRTDATGQPLYYKFYHVASRKNVLDDQCMQDVGVKINDVLRLQSAPLITRRDGEGAQDPRTSKVLLSYRRDDSVDVTGRMYDRLVTHYGSDQVFKDVDAIPL